MFGGIPAALAPQSLGPPYWRTRGCTLHHPRQPLGMGRSQVLYETWELWSLGQTHLQAEALPLLYGRRRLMVSHWHLPPPLGELPLSSSRALTPPVPILPQKSPLKFPPAQSCLETRVAGMLVGAPTSKNLESPTYFPIESSLNFNLRYEDK
jgi:hypothetical protein